MHGEQREEGGSVEGCVGGGGRDARREAETKGREGGAGRSSRRVPLFVGLPVGLCLFCFESSQTPVSFSVRLVQAPAEVTPRPNVGNEGYKYIAPVGLLTSDEVNRRFEQFGLPVSIYSGPDAPKRRKIRQHVNPLQAEHQRVVPPPAWEECYSDASLPLVVDIGCGYGRFSLALASTEAGKARAESEEPKAKAKAKGKGKGKDKEAGESAAGEAGSDDDPVAPAALKKTKVEAAEVGGDGDERSAAGAAEAARPDQAPASSHPPLPEAVLTAPLAPSLTRPRNHLGLEIRKHAAERANAWCKSLGLTDRAHFMALNATVSAGGMVASYPGAFELLTIQFPDPHFKKRHRKRRVVQPNFVRDVARAMRPGARVFLQGDVPSEVRDMRLTFATAVPGVFEPDALHADPENIFFADNEEPEVEEDDEDAGERSAEEGAKGPQHAEDDKRAEADEAAAKPAAQDEDATMSDPAGETPAAQGDPAAPAAHHPMWRPVDRRPQRRELPERFLKAGWLKENPLGVPTEREVHTGLQGRSVFRCLLIRTDVEVPEEEQQA